MGGISDTYIVYLYFSLTLPVDGFPVVIYAQVLP